MGTEFYELSLVVLLVRDKNRVELALTQYLVLVLFSDFGVNLSVTQEARYKCNFLSLMLTELDLVGLKWVDDAAVGSSWISFGRTMNCIEA